MNLPCKDKPPSHCILFLHIIECLTAVDFINGLLGLFGVIDRWESWSSASLRLCLCSIMFIVFHHLYQVFKGYCEVINEELKSLLLSVIVSIWGGGFKYSDLQFPEIIWGPISAHHVLFRDFNLMPVESHGSSELILRGCK